MENPFLSDKDALDLLVRKSLIGHQESDAWQAHQQTDQISIFWEIRTLFVLGMAMLVGAAGRLIYDHFFDALHEVLILLLVVLTMLAFRYCWQHSDGFSRKQTAEEKPVFFGIILLTATTAFAVLEGYVQFRYQLFGRYADLLIVATLVYLWSAYYFDDRNVLVKGLIALAAWLAIDYRTLDVEHLADTFAPAPVSASIGLGVTLVALGLVSAKLDIKAHFKNRYLLFATHLVLVALCGAIIHDKEGDNLIHYILLAVFWVLFQVIGATQKIRSIEFFALIYLYIGALLFVSKYLREPPTTCLMLKKMSKAYISGNLARPA